MSNNRFLSTDIVAKRARLIKIGFTLIVCLVIAAIATGINFIQAQPAWRARAIASKLRTIAYTAQWGIYSSRLATAQIDGYTAGNANSIPVLVYHGILPKWDNTDTNISRELFREHLFALKAAGYTTITTSELKAFLSGETSLPPHAVMITFDDGRKDSFYEADPILQTVGFKAVMFSIAKYNLIPKSKYYLDKYELLRMERIGRWDVQSHSYEGHDMIAAGPEGQVGPFFSTLRWDPETRELEDFSAYSERVREDLFSSRDLFAQHLGRSVIGIALPFGDFGQNRPEKVFAETILEHAHQAYSLVFFQEASPYRFSQVIAETPGAQSHLVRRISVDPNWSGEELVALLERGRAKELPFTATLKPTDGWIAAWGNITTDGRLSLVPERNEAGAAAILDGSQLWRDYSVRAEIQTNSGVVLWVRFRDDQNNASCNFGNGFAHVEQTVDGEKRVIKGERRDDIYVPEQAVIEARIRGRTLECFLDDRLLVSSDFVDQTLIHGGIGLKTWSDRVDSNLLVKKLAVIGHDRQLPTAVR